jgi:hypothetical protein
MIRKKLENEKKNGEWRVKLMSDWDSVIGAIRSLREKRMENGD